MKRRLTRFALLAFSSVMILVAVVVVRAVWTPSRQLVATVTPAPAIRAGAAQRLAAAVQLRTISNVDESAMDLAPFAAFQEQMVANYPAAHKAMRLETVAPCTRIYHWGPEQGAPVVFMGHTDVVPVEEDKLGSWTHGPFSGAIADGFIWGRGTLDDKINVMGLLEAADFLASQGFVPARRMMFVFGCDEEVGGTLGASRVAKLLKERNIRPQWVVDEGHIIGKGFFPGVAKPIAFVGLAEKGFVTLDLSVEAEGGHSSIATAHRCGRVGPRCHSDRGQPAARTDQPSDRGDVRLPCA
ncbi:MAG: M20/M25/M40 family metallo-hydrolase [bacterium]